MKHIVMKKAKCSQIGRDIETSSRPRNYMVRLEPSTTTTLLTTPTVSSDDIFPQPPPSASTAFVRD